MQAENGTNAVDGYGVRDIVFIDVVGSFADYQEVADVVDVMNHNLWKEDRGNRRWTPVTPVLFPPFDVALLPIDLTTRSNHIYTLGTHRSFMGCTGRWRSEIVDYVTVIPVRFVWNRVLSPIL